MSLTKRQREILTYLANYSEEHGYAPSFEEIATQFNYNSLATVPRSGRDMARGKTSDGISSIPRLSL